MKKNIPIWVVPIVIVFCLAVVGVIAWKSMSKNSAASNAPNMEVHPGMYDIRKEAESGHLGQKQPGSPLSR
jgi:heme/copper-type cytochrome/quinol oxidase subunit 2